MRRRRVARAGVVLTAIALSGCVVPEALPGGVREPTTGPTTAPFDLYTHCGIDALTFAGQWYQRVGGPLDDGQGNPPDGWDNPYHPGTLTTSGARATFTDDDGHRETFGLREGATAPEQICS